MMYNLGEVGYYANWAAIAFLFGFFVMYAAAIS